MFAFGVAKIIDAPVGARRESSDVRRRTGMDSGRRPDDRLLSVKYNCEMHTRDMAKALGARGGRARAKRLAPRDRKRIAALGGRARADSIAAARRIADNFRYLATMRVMPGRTTAVVRLEDFRGRLPGIYDER